MQSNSTIRDNYATKSGGGIYFYFGTPDLVNNTITSSPVAETHAVYDCENGKHYGGSTHFGIAAQRLLENTPVCLASDGYQVQFIYLGKILEEIP